FMLSISLSLAFQLSKAETGFVTFTENSLSIFSPMYQIIHCMVSTGYVLFFGENYILSIVMPAWHKATCQLKSCFVP
ncbi:hypothetical protein, partial [Dickeya ananatis]